MLQACPGSRSALRYAYRFGNLQRTFGTCTRTYDTYRMFTMCIGRVKCKPVLTMYAVYLRLYGADYDIPQAQVYKCMKGLQLCRLRHCDHSFDYYCNYYIFSRFLNVLRKY